MKSKVIACLVAVLFLFSCGAGMAVADDGFTAFRDTEGYWAEETIARTAALGLVRGYPGGVFEPRSQVTRAELVVMLMRTLGLEQEAAGYHAAAYGYAKPDVGDWAQGPLVLAAHKGWIGSNLADTDFRAAASRVDVAIIVARALNLSTDGAVITFADLERIPASHRPYVAAVVRERVMQGVPGNRFEPTRGVTRAEMTALMTNMLETGLADPYPGRQFTAELRTVAGNMVTLRTVVGERTYTLANSYLVYRANERATPSSLAGRNVRVVLDGDGKVRFLGYTSGGVAGMPGAGSEVPGTIGDTTKAYVVNKYWDHMTVRYDDGTREEVDIKTATRFYRDDRAADYDTVSRGVPVELVKSGVDLAEVRILDGAYKLFGKVTSVSSFAVTIEDADEHRVTVDFADRVRVQDSDGNRMDLDDVSRDDRVELRLDKDGQADEVTLDFRQGDQEGVVTQIRTGHTPRITIQRGARTENFDLDRDVRVRRDGATLYLDEVLIGAEVKLVMVGKRVITIEIIDDENVWVEGKITRIDEDRGRLTIEQKNGTFRFDFAKGAILRDHDGDSLRIRDLCQGMDVELDLRDGEIYRLNYI